MKTKDEIEQLAKEAHYDSQNQGLNADGCFNQYQGFIKGYTQCQEDNADKKYTEEDVINALHSVELKNNKDYSKVNLKNY